MGINASIFEMFNVAFYHVLLVLICAKREGFLKMVVEFLQKRLEVTVGDLNCDILLPSVCFLVVRLR